ncbi:MAG: glycoside hydrolase family 57 protein [Phycisphaerales bacterium]|nr:glycoside hydrolase family 57 protein [Phycisphaerales bacterium]
MASIVFYSQVHQPHRLKPYSVFHTDPFYFNDEANRQICEKVANKCYRPTTKLMLDLIRRHEGNFRISYSITGTVLDQFKKYTPDVIELFQELAATGCCEFVGETYYHSLCFLYSQDEFRQQVEMHTKLTEELFGQTPKVFRNTELIYANELANALSQIKDANGDQRFLGTLCEGTDRHLGYRSPNFVYQPPASKQGALMGPDGRPFGLLLKNYKLSDDIAFRFGNKGWEEYPLNAEKFARWVHNINGDGYLCNLFMDYETFGEHQWEDTGIFKFLEKLPEAVFDVAHKEDGSTENHFITPSEALTRFDPIGEYDVPEYISWADTERDLTAWRGNAMQHNALEETYRLERAIKDRISEAKPSATAAQKTEMNHLLNDWRKLTTSDHFYYMCTKYWADGDVHKYFSPYDSPYDGYINFMNVLDNVRTRLAGV